MDIDEVRRRLPHLTDAQLERLRASVEREQTLDEQNMEFRDHIQNLAERLWALQAVVREFLSEAPAEAANWVTRLGAALDESRYAPYDEDQDE